MKNEFLEALGSNNANNNTDLSLYSRFVGNWSFTMTTYDEEGKIEDTKEGEWLFSYVMDGYGIQDVFICPKRGEWTEEDTLYGDYGTTIRVPMIDNSKKWNIVYVSKWSVDRLIAEELENDIIQTGINKDANDTTIWQWNFKNIEKDTFSWESIYSKDCGKTWKYAKSSPNLCVNSSFSYVVLSTLLLSSRDLTEWSLVYHNTLSYQRFYDIHSIHYDHLEGLHQSVV